MKSILLDFPKNSYFLSNERFEERHPASEVKSLIFSLNGRDIDDYLSSKQWTSRKVDMVV